MVQRMATTFWGSLGDYSALPDIFPFQFQVTSSNREGSLGSFLGPLICQNKPFSGIEKYVLFREWLKRVGTL